MNIANQLRLRRFGRPSRPSREGTLADVILAAAGGGGGETVGPELMPDPEFLTGTGWLATGGGDGGAGVTFGSGTLDFNTLSNQSCRGTVTITAGKTYRISFIINSYVRGIPRVAFGSDDRTFGGAPATHTYDVTSGSTASSFNIYGGTFAAGGQYQIESFSVKEIT